MNHIRRIGIDGLLTCAPPNPCHPEQSKDPYNLHGGPGDARNFRIAIRFFDDHDSEVLYSREAAEWESPARQCRVTTTHLTESRRDATPA